MRILTIADFHGAKQVLPRLKRKIIELSSDVIVFSGDIVKGTLGATNGYTLKLWVGYP